MDVSLSLIVGFVVGGSEARNLVTTLDIKLEICMHVFAATAL